MRKAQASIAATTDCSSLGRPAVYQALRDRVVTVVRGSTGTFKATRPSRTRDNWRCRILIKCSHVVDKNIINVGWCEGISSGPTHLGVQNGPDRCVWVGPRTPNPVRIMPVHLGRECAQRGEPFYRTGENRPTLAASLDSKNKNKTGQWPKLT
jgi:hypothetical protein